MLNSVLTFALVINELMSSNAGTVMSPATGGEEWGWTSTPTPGAIDTFEHSKWCHLDLMVDVTVKN